MREQIHALSMKTLTPAEHALVAEPDASGASVGTPHRHP
jgi:hypothetical protein